jgi:hypothetical protein
MIRKIRKSVIGKLSSLLMAFVLFITSISPFQSYALTGGPAQPEFGSFTPIGTSDMVDLSSGDFSYNIPLMDIGGFPINLAYNSGVTMDDEASWVGLGWNLSIGQINRDMRGLPDDFKGEQMVYENNIKDNYTVGTSLTANAALFGADNFPPKLDGELGLSMQYNSYTGASMNPSAGISYDVAKNASVGLNVTSTQDGLVVSPNVSLHARYKTSKSRDNSVSSSVGISLNSRQGLSSVNMSASRNTVTKTGRKYKGVGSYSTGGNIGSSISYVDNHYTPNVQDGITSVNFTFNAAIGGELIGLEGQGQIAAYGSNQFISESEKTRYEASYGYEYSHVAGKNDVMDFNREKDGNFSENSTTLPITNYTYDIYAVQGQGVSGMFRPYRSQVGYVHDNETKSNGGGLSGGIELGAGNAVHFGADVEVTYTHSKAGEWLEGNLAHDKFTSEPNSNPAYEEVYFKNVGDLSVDEDHGIYGGSAVRFGGYYPSRLKISGDPYDRKLESTFQIKQNPSYGSGPMIFQDYPFNENELKRDNRIIRNQAILKITVGEAVEAESEGHPFLGFETGVLTGVSADQTAGFIVTRNDGARYVYGKPLYNTTKKEVTFAIGDEVGNGTTSGNTGSSTTGLVGYLPGVDNSIDNTRGDHYFNRITTPKYAHTYLLTTLLSSDYSDIDLIPGPSDNDLGSYTKFSYRNTGEYEWRIPYHANQANYSEGLKTDPTDDRASYVYGSKEQEYIQKIETKTHVAIFHVLPRNDGYGVDSENGSLANMATSSKMYRLVKISLYSKGEYIETGNDVNGNITVDATSTPIKEVHFEYDYSMCKGVPNNDNQFFDGDGDSDNDNFGGKLTLRKVYFTYRNSKMGKYSPYTFLYGNVDHDLDEEVERNPNYNLKGYDIWGSYKKNDAAGQGNGLLDHLPSPEFAYVDQEDPNLNDYYSAWSLSDINLPSGGKIQVDYEADDYETVQDQPTMRMFKIAGCGVDADPTISGSNSVIGDFNTDVNTGISQLDNEALLYKTGSGGSQDANFFYVQLDEQDQIASITSQQVYDKYLKAIVEDQQELIQFRMLLNMTHQGGKDNGNWNEGNFDYVTGYMKPELSGSLTQPVPISIFNHSGKKYFSFPVVMVDMEAPGDDLVNPVSKAGWFFARKYLPQYTYEYEAINDSGEPGALVNAILDLGDNLYEAFAGANGLLRGKEIARRFIPEKSWMRLMNPRNYKTGGGCRVKQLAMTDEWANMTANENGGVPDLTRDQKYGQEYTYTYVDENLQIHSSGVATYEPVGAKDNPFCQPVFVNETRLLAPDEENYVEKPFGESFFPAPTITYSRVEVKNLERVESGLMVKKHATGSVVTEFFTSRDYPTIVDQTSLKVHEDDPGVLNQLLNVNVKKHITLSQGYVVHLNDMNGKMKSQRVYAEGQPEAISGVDYHYDTFTSSDPSYPDNPFTVVTNPLGHINNNVRVIYPDGTVDTKTIGVEFDIVNDFREMTSETEIVGVNGNVATFFIGFIPGIVPLPLPDYAHHEDKLNMSVTTKVINSYGILREVVAHDAGASVSTKNLLWDAFTGEVLLTQTLNEYGDDYYSFNYPAHWYYSGMSLASLNLGNAFSFEPVGSVYELTGSLVENEQLHNGDEIIYVDVNNNETDKAWVHNVTALNFELMDKNGLPVTNIDPASNFMKIYRSGHRNIQSTSMASVVFMNESTAMNLLNGGITDNFLEENLPEIHRIVNAGAVEFSDEWALQCECIINENGVYNPYRFNTLGVWRALRSHLYLTGRNNTAGVSPRNEGFYNKFTPFYQITAGNWGIDNTDWTFTSQVTQFSPFGFELENKDALNRYSGAQYGYNYMFPLAVGANTQYSEFGYDGFEDYFFAGCPTNEHFGFRDQIDINTNISDQESHTGKYSLKIAGGGKFVKLISLPCP